MATKRPNIQKENAAYKRAQKAKGRKLDAAGRFLPSDIQKDTAMLQFWKGVDRDNLKEALVQSGDPVAQSLANYMLLGKPVNMGKACRECGITLQKLNELYQKHNLALGMIGVSEHLPQVMVDTAIDAKSQFVVCDRCDGLGEITRTRIVDDKATKTDEVCPKCKGEREVRVSGDPKARDQIFEMVGLTGKQSGPLVALQQNFTGLGDSLEDTLNVAQKLLIKPEAINGHKDS